MFQRRNEMIAHLKDQLQEMKAKTAMERKYVQKSSEVSVTQTKKKCDLSIKDLADEIRVCNFIVLQIYRTGFNLVNPDQKNHF